MGKTPMTRRGAEQLREELQRLKTVERPRISAAIAEARGHGDITENAEYDAARERQALVEARIRDIESKLAHAHVIDPRTLHADGRVVFGATVELEDEADGATVSYQIVGEDEADIRAGKISVGSPIARALIGKHAGDDVAVQTPGGEKRYSILDVRYE
jgi:transcription elongation factor GreA